MEKTITVMGDNCVDAYVPPTDARYPGGNAVNVAMHLQRLGHQVRYAGRVGDDEAGAWLLGALGKSGVDTSLVRQLPGATGVTTIALENGERTFLDEVVGVQSPLTFSPDTLAAAADQTNFLVTTAFAGYDGGPLTHEPAIREELAFFQERGVPTAMDFSERQETSLMRLLGPLLEVAFVSAPDLDDAAAEALGRQLQALGPTWLVVTRGPRGSFAVQGDRVISCPAHTITPVDTLGAGDSFLAGFIAAYVNGVTVKDCLEQATAVATAVCLHFGAYPFAEGELG